jgi:hypothetical protein
MLHSGRLRPYPLNIRLSWKGLLGKNTLALHKNSQIIAIKSFIIAGTNVIKLFASVIYDYS